MWPARDWALNLKSSVLLSDKNLPVCHRACFFTTRPRPSCESVRSMEEPSQDKSICSCYLALGIPLNRTEPFMGSNLVHSQGQTQILLEQGCQTHFHQGPHQPRGCLPRVNVILGLCKCNCSLAIGKELSWHCCPVETRCQARLKKGGGPDSVCGPCVCHLCPQGSSTLHRKLMVEPGCSGPIPHTVLQVLTPSWGCDGCWGHLFTGSWQAGVWGQPPTSYHAISKWGRSVRS